MARGRATNPPARLNRSLLAVIGILLIAAALLAAGISTGQLPLVPTTSAVVPSASLPSWAAWVVAVVGIVVGLLALRWLIAQARRRPIGSAWSAEAAGPVGGRTAASSSVIADALCDDLVAHPAIADATARLTAPAPRPALYVELAVDAQADATAARAHLEQHALPRLRTALGTDTLPVELLLRTGRASQDERRVA
ncbi:hypothetical protein [Actinomycetospora sp. CA-084318]|uniref:hypothetical protein n=1 Tax=Actinomycetospora sp. CA-084318 TaxID=3239892 RepID=UPI003D98F346